MLDQVSMIVRSGSAKEIRFPLGMPQRDQQLTGYYDDENAASSPSRLVRTGATSVWLRVIQCQVKTPNLRIRTVSTMRP